jgi:hypothetical protein
LPPVEDVECEGLLRATSLQAVEVETRAQTVAKVELLTDADIGPRAHQNTDRPRSTFMIVSNPDSLKSRRPLG